VGTIGHEFRWNPARVAVGHTIDSGAIGEVRVATIVEYSPFLRNPAMQMPAWFEEPSIGGWLGATGSHMLDQLLVWFGPVSSVSARTLVAGDRAHGAEDSYSARFRHRSGTEAVIQQVGAAWSGRSLTVATGTQATVGIDDDRAWIADGNGNRTLDAPAGCAETGAARADDGGLDDLGSYERRHYERLCAAFRAAIEGVADESPVPLPTFRDGLSVMRCMDAIRASAAAGGALQEIDPG
jgi:predicted dehydrogenase